MKTNWGTGTDMTTRTVRTTVIALIVCIALPVWGQQYLLYSPQALPPGQKLHSKDGVLVQEIKIQKGDTLYGLSKKYSGHGRYFPQILLFNSIKNPNLIYYGNTLRVPVSHKEGFDKVDVTTADSNQETKTTGYIKTQPKTEADFAVMQPTAVQTKKNQAPSSSPYTSSTLPATSKKAGIVPSVDEEAVGAKLFEAAVRAYRQDDCRSALELLDRYLAHNSGSALAADANLYKAECYLKLSAP
jgi:LysM repeat protein